MGVALFWIFTIGGAAFAGVGLITWLAGDLLDRRSERLVAIVIEISALAAVTSGNEPTVLTAVNIALVVILGAAVPAAASRCQPWLVAASCVPVAVCGVLATDPPIFGPSLGIAAAAIALAIVFVGLRAPVLRALAGGLMVQAALRLPWPDAVGMSALVAGLCVTPVLIVGWVRGRTKERRVAGAIAGLVAAVMLIGVVSAAVLGLKAQSDARDGVSATQRAIDALVAGDRELAATELTDAYALIASVDSATHSWWSSAGLVVPVLSQHLDLARKLTENASEALDAAQAANEQADPRELRLDGASVDLAKVASFQPLLERASGALQRLDNTIAQASNDVWIVRPLRDRLAEVDDDVTRARRDAANALDVVRSAPGLLGGEGDRRYLLAIMTPAELRGTIGILGSYGEVAASNGAIDLVKIGRNSELNTGGLGPDRVLNAPDDYVARYSAFDPAYTWQNIPMSPDWPTNAAIMADLYPQSGGGAVDGVIGMDPIALTAFLQITGPISVPSWPEPITSENARQILLIDQYGAFGDRSDRVSFLGEVAGVLWAKLLSSSPDPIALADALGPVAREGHLMIWSKQVNEEDLFRRLGISGQMAPLVGDDVIAVTGINTGGDKLDAFLQRTVDYAVTWDPSAQSLAATVGVTLHNTAPASGLPAYVTGFADGNTGVEGQNRDWTTVYSPLDFDSAELNGSPVGPDLATELGRNAISQYVRIDPGATIQFDVHLTGRATGTQYRVNVTRQPMVLQEKFTISVKVPAGWTLASPTNDVRVDQSGSVATIDLGPARDHLVVFDARPIGQDR